MKLISLTICRNAEWSIAAILGHALTYCDGAVVLCHACTDGTEDIARSFGAEVIAIPASSRWDEMDHRQATLERGREIGGTHFLILDDDELVTEPLKPTIRTLAEMLAPGEIVQQPMLCCWRSMAHYRCDFGSVFRKLHKSTVFRDDPALGWRTKDGYHHHHTHPYNSVPKRHVPRNGGSWLHLQHASWPRLVTKQTWYMAMEVCRYGKVIANYRGSMDEKGLQTRPVPSGWWPKGVAEKIDLGLRPWQADDLRRMVDEKGEVFFKQRGVDVATALEYWE